MRQPAGIGVASLVVGIAILSSCGSAPVTPVTDQQEVRAREAVARAEAAWARRGDEAAAREAAEAYGIAMENGATDARVPAAQAHFFLADCHLRFRGEARGEFLSELERSVRLAREAVAAEEPDALYWLAEARWVWARAQGPATFLMVEDELHTLARASRAIDAEYDGYGSDRMLGSLLARTPGFAGGDLVASERHFTAARSGAPEDDRNDIRMAAEFAVATQNRELFVQLIDEVLGRDNDSPEAICARRQAEQLQGKVEKFFPLEPGENN